MSNYFDLQNSPILTTPSDLTAPKITTIGYPGDDTAADPAGGQTITLTGAGFEAGASVIINGNAVGVVSVVSSTTITFTSPAQSAGSYPIYVVNTDGGTAIAVPGIQYSGTPNWTTAAGSLGSYTETTAISNTVTATGDAPITYSLFSGSLPTGATLNSANGLISGTSPLAASPTTYTFTIRATDAEQQDTNRQFSLTINPDVVTWSTPANNTTYSSVANSAISNVTLSATAASGQTVSYTANALPTGLSLSGSNITGTPTVVANSSTLLTATAATTNATATRTINWVISVANDPDFEYVTTLLSANTPASTFVTDASTNSFAVTVFGDAKPSNFGPYTPGYYSNYFDGTGDSLAISSSAVIPNTQSTFTIEGWLYMTANPVASGGGNIVPGMFGDMQPAGVTNYLSMGPVGSAGTYYFGFYWYDSTSRSVRGDTVLALNTWYHLAVSVSGNAIKLFVNGVEQTLTGTTTLTNRGGNSGTFAIGNFNTNTSSITGYISNLRVVNGTAVYTSAFTPSTTPLTAIANTSLLTCQSNRLIDNSTNNFTITRNGDVRVDSFDPFLPDTNFAGRGSGYFSATSAYGRVAMAGADSFGTGDFTVECWLYPSNSAINISMPSASTNSWAILTFGNQLYWQQSGGNLGDAGYGTVPLNTWTHLAVARSGSTIRLFVNGAQVYSASNSFNYSGAPATRTIGPGEGGGVPAYISDFRVVKGTAVYTTTFTPPATPLTAVANTSLLTLQNNQPNNNSMFLDSSTNNFNITRNGNTTQGSFSPYGGGWSNYFGSGSSLNFGTNTAFAFGTGDFTMEAWVNDAGTTAVSSIIIGATSYGVGTNVQLFYDGSTKKFGYYGQTGVTFLSSVAVSVGTWNHIAVVRSGTTVTLYLNGSSVGSTTDGNNITSTIAMTIGASSNNNANTYFIGYISNARIVKGTAVYTSNFTPSTSPLTPIANTSLLTCADNRFIDDSPNNLTVTANGTPSVQRFNPFNPVATTPTSYSGFFDGTGDFLKVSNTNLSQQLYDLGTSGDFTVEAWVYPTFSIWSGYNDVFLVGSVGMLVNAGKLIAYGFNNNPISGTTMSLNAWTHIAICRSGGTLRGFQNGVQVFSVVDTNRWPQNSPTRIGVWSGESSEFWQGYISNIRVSNNARYPSAFTPSTAPFTADANTLFLTCQSATFIDNSTNGYAITASGDTAPRQFNPFGWTTTTGGSATYTPALYGGGAYFDGTGDYLSVPASAFPSTGNFTAEAWVYATSTSTAPVFYLGGDGDSYAGLRLQITGGGNFYLLMTTAYGSWTINSGNIGSTPRNTWIHVAVVRSAGNIFVFQNGVSIYTSTALSAASTLYASSNYLIAAGASNLGTGINAFFAGYISDARITKGVARYTSNFQPPVAPLTALQNTTLLANMTGAGIYDSSMITTYETAGNAGINTSIKKYGNTSMYFDGTGDYLITPPLIEPYLFRSSADWTIEFWFNTTSNSATMGIIDTYYVNAGPYGGLIIRMTSGQISTWDGATNRATTETYNNGAWNHLAWTNSGGTSRIFINGTNVSLGGVTSWSTPSNIYRANAQLQIARLFSGETFNGYLADLRITMGVARYTSNFTPTATPFLAN